MTYNLHLRGAEFDEYSLGTNRITEWPTSVTLIRLMLYAKTGYAYGYLPVSNLCMLFFTVICKITL